MSVYDPQAMEKARKVFASIHYCADPYELAEGAEALIVATEWPEFKSLDWPCIGRLMQRPLVFDGRNLLDARAMETLGFEYYGVGVPSAAAEAKRAPMLLVSR